METNYFSQNISNLFIGLCKGSPKLRPYSEYFSKNLGYEIFKFEESFKITIGSVKPDVILNSKKVKNTLIIEWTEAKIFGERKRSQLLRYSKIDSEDLTDVLALPADSTKSYNITLILKKESVNDFSSFIKNKSWNFPVLEFGTENGKFYLIKVENSFDEEKTDRFFSEGIKVDRIPLNYLPIPLDNIEIKNLVHHVVIHLIYLILKEIQEFTIIDFCREIIPVWDFISNDKKKDINKSTKTIFKRLIRKPFGKNILERTISDPPTWKLIGKEDFNSKSRSYRKSLQAFIIELKSEIAQHEIPF